MNLRLAIFVGVLFFVLNARAATNQLLRFEEVLSIVRSNLTDVSESELSHAAAAGLLQQLGSRVQLVTTNTAAEPVSNVISRAAIYARSFGYLRVVAVTGQLADELDKAWHALAASNRLKGTILDLRYAKGSDYAGAAEAADLFVLTEQPLLRAGEREFRSSKSARKLKGPVAVLVNSQTSGAAEALAGALRETGAALVIGSNTAGEARLFETIELSTGQKLRVGKVPVQIGGKVISTNGVAPDIAVSVNSLDERAYFQDPFVMIPRGLTAGGTNDLARARRITEADLVRRHREGLDLTATPEESAPAPNQQIIMDPALARAVDFLKGLAALRQGGTD